MCLARLRTTLRRVPGSRRFRVSSIRLLAVRATRNSPVIRASEPPAGANHSSSPAQPPSGRSSSGLSQKKGRLFAIAAMRFISATCIKRSGKIFSVTMLLPSASANNAMSCACKSVGKPGYGCVVRSAGLSLPLRVTMHPPFIFSTVTPILRRRSTTTTRIWSARAASSRLTSRRSSRCSLRAG